MSLLVGALVVVLIFLGVAFWFAKHLLWVAVNSLIGVLALMGWNILFTPVTINLLSVALVAIFGIFGLIAVVALHMFGVAF